MKLALLIVFVAIAAYSAAEEFVCQQNVPYIENECNGCHCEPNLGLSCTLMACLERDRANLYNCEIGTTWDKECNKCWCVKDRGTICSNNKC